MKFFSSLFDPSSHANHVLVGLATWLLVITITVVSVRVLAASPNYDQDDLSQPSSSSLFKGQTSRRDAAQADGSNNMKEVEQLTTQLMSELQRYNSASSEKEKVARLILLQQLANTRGIQLAILGQKNPAAFLKTILPSSARSVFPMGVRDLLEKNVTETGTFHTVEQEDFSNLRNTERNTLQTNHNTYSLYSPKDVPPLQSNSTIKVKGIAIRHVLVTSNSTGRDIVVVRSGSPIHTDATSRQNTLLFLVNFSDDHSQPFSRERASHLFFDPPVGPFTPSLNAYYQEASYGQTSFTGSVVDWYTLPSTLADTCDDTDDIMWRAMENAQAQHVDLSSYKHFVVFFPNCGEYGYSDIGTTNVTTPEAVVAGTRTWITQFANESAFIMGTKFYSVAVHELGHALGLRHGESESYAPNVLRGSIRFPRIEDYSPAAPAGTIVPGSPEWYGLAYDRVVGPGNGGTLSEYGDFYNAMGGVMNQDVARHFSAPQKNNLGWFSARQVREVTGSGNYTIEPLETASRGIKMLKIPRTRNASGRVLDWYALEYRQPIGFDLGFDADFSGWNVTRGVLVHHQISAMDQWTASYLLNMEPLDNSWTNAALPIGRTYTDSISGISFTPTSMTTSSIVLNVQYPTESALDLVNPDVFPKKVLPTPSDILDHPDPPGPPNPEP